MGNRDPARVALMFVELSCFLVAVVFNTMAGVGERSGLFTQSTEDFILKYRTPITPAAWSLFMWDFIYIWLGAMFLYFLLGLYRRNVCSWMYTTPAVLPYGFHVSLIISLSLNITTLFLYDREMLLPALIISALMTFANYMILFFTCHGLKVYGAWLDKFHTADLWLTRILVQNGVALYATWGTICTLLNLTIYLQHQTITPICDCAMVSLTLIVMELLVWWLLENLYLDEHVRYIVTIYPVTIIWLTGSVTNSSSPESYMNNYAVLILVASCVMFVARIALVIWRHHKRPLHSDSTLSMSPVEIALTQRKYLT